jgi:hypothetical protein
MRKPVATIFCCGVLRVLSACADAEPAAPSAIARMEDAGAAHDVPAVEQRELDAAVAADASAASSALRVNLLSPEGWTMVDAGDDPFTDRPASVDCSTAWVGAETLSGERVLGVETGYCNYATMLEPTRRDVRAGETIKVRLWHFELSAPEPAEAHAALLIAGLPVLDERIAIPQPGAFSVKELRVERAIPAGAPAYFHLHNHGQNSWALVEVSVGAAP